MSEEASTQGKVQFPVEGSLVNTKETQETLQNLVTSLRMMHGDIGQICELASEERNLVAAFIESLSKVMRPLTKTLPVSSQVFPRNGGKVIKACIDHHGHLLILDENGQMELKDLGHPENLNLMISVAEDVLPKLGELTRAYRQTLENRISFLSSITKEMQKISKALATALSGANT
ncbi:MAG: hypothetical protein JSV64_08935 [Candidatus Bathyarchaeota archaeon]|nr:MAG: hypothetical protein JSV64_08935 [Candidatus Bathyarchaeota archaeon]